MSVSLTIGHTPNYATVTVGPLTLEYSYSTVIAFRSPETGRVIRSNDWGPTTGKHLNALDGGSAEAKKRRIPGDEFERQLEAVVSRIKIV